jgi:hypothetical protein
MAAAARTWAEGDIARLHECSGIVLFVFFLHFESDVDAVGLLQGWVVVAEESTVVEESKVLDAEDFRYLFFALLDLDIFTRAHGKEKGKSCEVGDGTLQWGEILLCNFGNDTSRDCCLLCFFWVFVCVGSELAV